MELNLKKIKLIDFPAEIRHLIFKQLSISTANKVRKVNTLFEKDIDSFQTSKIEIDDRKPEQLPKQLQMRSDECKITHFIQPQIKAKIFRHPSCIRSLTIERISEPNLRAVLKQCGKHLKRLKAHLPSPNDDDNNEDAYLLNILSTFALEKCNELKALRPTETQWLECTIKSYMSSKVVCPCADILSKTLEVFFKSKCPMLRTCNFYTFRKGKISVEVLRGGPQGQSPNYALINLSELYAS